MTLRVAGHPLHPALAHLPIGAWLSSAVWDIAALISSDPLWWRMAYLSIALGLVGSVLAAVAGFVDYLGLAGGGTAERTANRHSLIVLVSTTCYFVSLLLRRGGESLVGGDRLASIALAGIGLLFLGLGGWLGGELVYRHGVGVDPPGSKDDRIAS